VSVFQLKENKTQDYHHKPLFHVMKKKIMDAKEELFQLYLIMPEKKVW
jgi:hypothetical protein